METLPPPATEPIERTDPRRILSDEAFHSLPHVDCCNCVVGYDDPTCVAYRATLA